MKRFGKKIKIQNTFHINFFHASLLIKDHYQCFKLVCSIQKYQKGDCLFFLKLAFEQAIYNFTVILKEKLKA